MNSDLQTVPPSAINGSGQQDLAALGALVNQVGFSPAAARALVAQIQSAGISVALSVTPELVEQMRQLTAARFADLAMRIQMMSGIGPYVRRDQVLMMIQNTMTINPKA